MAEALMIGTAVVGAVGSLVSGEQTAQAYKASGKVEQELANYRAKQLEQNAGQERAASQHRAEQERKQAKLVLSRNRAAAAASGAGLSGIENIMAGISGEGEYNARSALYEGEEAARGLEAQAAAERTGGRISRAMGTYTAKAARRSSYLEAAGNLLSGSASFMDRYWPETTTSTGSVTMNRSGTKMGRYSSQVAYG